MNNVEKKIQQSLQDGAKSTAVPPETYEKILSDVLEEADAASRPTYASAVVQLPEREQEPRKRWTKVVVGFGSLAAVVCLCFLAVPSLFSPPAVDDGALITIDDDNVPLAAIPELPGYDMEVTAYNPQEGIVLRLEGNLAGIDWASIWAIDEAGERVPATEIDGEQGLIAFAYPSGELTLHLSDAEGNIIFWPIEHD